MRLNPLDVLTMVVSILVVLSLSTERMVEIVKGWIPFLSKENTDASWERTRKWCLQILAVVAGIVTSFLAEPILPETVRTQLTLDTRDLVVLGFLASGGSGFWNAILGYLKGIKDIKQVQAVEARAKAAANAEVRAKLLQ